MAKYSNVVTYDIKTTLDASGITKLQSELNKVQTTLNSIAGSPGKMKSLGLNVDEVQLYQTQIEQLGKTISQCFNSRTGMLNVSQFNTALKSGVLDVRELNGAFKAAGNQGKTAFNSVISMMTNVNKQAVTVNSTMAKIANTFGNTVRWGITASIFQEMMGSIQGAVSYMKDLDESLTQIQMVTNSSKEDMRELAQYANNAAQALGSTTTDYTNAVKVFVQEGFSERESKQYANLSTKLANVSEQDTQTTSDQITAYRNAFQLDYKQTVEAMDKVANVANNTASNVSELMTASQRSASVAQAVGASQDSFLAAIATIESVTRQSAEEIGNGLKTIYQRFADIRVGKTLEDGADYGEYAQALKKVGVDVLDMEGNFKGFDRILAELQEVWGNLSETMKVAVGEKVAGKFQYNRFAALMNNPEYYQKSLNATQGATGMMDQMNDIYIGSIEGRLNTLQAAGEQVMSTLFDQDNIEPVIENVTNLVNGLNTVIEVAGGGIPVFTALSALLLKTFSPQIAAQITQIATNMATMTQASNNMKNMQAAMNLAGQMGQGLNSRTFEVANKAVPVVTGLDQAAQEKMTALVQQMAEAENKVVIAENNINELAAQLTTKYQQRLHLTEGQAVELQEILFNSIKNNESQDQIRASVAETLKLQGEDLEVIRLTRTEVNNMAQSYREMNAATESVDANLRAADTAIGGFKSEQIARGFTQALSAATSLVFTIQSFTSLMSILNSDTASFEEKFNSVLISGTMMLSMLGTMATSLKSSFDAIVTGLGFSERAAALEAEAVAQQAYNKAVIEATAAQERLNIAKITGNSVLIEETQATLADAMAKREEALATRDAAAAKVQEMGATKANSEATLANVVAVGKENLTIKANEAIKREGTVTSKLYAAGEKILGTAATGAAEGTVSLGAAIARIAFPIGIAAAAIGVLVFGYQKWQESIHASSIEFEKQKELLSKTKKAYTDAADEVESLKNSLDSIGESRSSLDDLTKGTDEWRAAVRKLNDEILTLLETYPELAQYVTNKDGLLTLDEAGSNKFYQQQLDEADHLASLNAVQQAKTLQIQNDKFVEDFSNKWGISKENVTAAIQEGKIELSGSDALNSAFKELKNSLETNSLAIENLSDNVGTLNNTYTDYSSNKEIDVQGAERAIQERFGTHQHDEYGNDLGVTLDFNTVLDNQDFLDAVAEATGEKIIGARDTSPFDSNIAFKTAEGDEVEYSSEQLLNLLADSQAAIDLTNQKLEENKAIYEAFGATYNEVTRSFIDASGKTVNSLDDLEGASADEIAAIKAFQEGIYNDIAFTKFHGSLEEFAAALGRGELNVDNFSEALLAAQVQQKEEGISEKLGGLIQTNGLMTTDLSSGVSKNMQFTPEQAQMLMSDMMKKLNESNLSDEEKLQLMDKINWDMPVQDILANIQHAIDTGNIESAFIGTGDLEDDSDRKTQVAEEYDIDESTLDVYAEQLQTTGELAEQHEKLANALEQSKEQFGEGSEEVKKAKNALASFDDESEDIAVDLAQTQKGLESLSSNMAKYSDILKKGDKTTLEYAEALGAVKGSLADTLNVSEESLSNSVVEDHLEDIEALASGDIEALDRLRAAAGQDIVAGFYMAEDSNLTEEHMEYLKQKALEINSLDIEVGADLNDEGFRAALNDMLYNGELTRDQVNEYLHAIGAEPHFETIQKPTTLFSTAGMTVSGEAFGIPYSFALPPFQIDGMVDVPQIVPEGGSRSGGGGTGLRRTASPTAPSGKSGISPNYVNDAYKPKSSGSNKSPKKDTGSNKNNQKKEKEKGDWDYLTDITNDLERQSAVIEKLSKLEDRLYGKRRISQLQKLQVEHKKNLKLLKEEKKLAEKHAKRLQTNAYDENGNLTISGYAYRAGKPMRFDSKGNLDNGRELEQIFLKRVNNAVANYNKHRNDEDTGQYEWDLDQAKKDYDGFLKAMSEYQSTLGTIDDTKSKIQDEKEELQNGADAIVDAIQEGVEDVVKAMDSRREFNKMYRNWMEGGSGYSHFNNDRRYATEGLRDLLSGKGNKKSIFDTQLISLQNRIADVEDVFKTSKNAEGDKYSEQDALENLQAATENILGTLQDAIKYYDSLLDTIDDASNKMDELIDNRLDQFNELEDFLDVRLNQIKLLFGEKSYEDQAALYNRKIAVNMEKLVSINTAIEAKKDVVETLETLEATNKKLSTEDRKTLKEAKEEVNKLQQEQLNTETELLQDIASKLEAEVSQTANNMVNQMFGGADIDWLSQQWELATRNSEKYLDDYNRAFELQKLQLKFQEALNDNQTASLNVQQKINNLANEYLTYLREKSHLSEYDVKHAQMELDILQKQIALEEARNNKSQMQLQRNAAGNYDFVYGADEEAVTKATEALLAAQQDSYNLSKEKYLETYEAAYEAAIKTRDMVVEIATDASLSVEERNQRIQETINSLSDYLEGSSTEINEISINLYNSFVDAEQSIASENVGALSEIFDTMAAESTKTVEKVSTDVGSVKEDAAGKIEETKDSALGSMKAIADGTPTHTEAIAKSFGLMKDNIVGSDGIFAGIESRTGQHLNKISHIMGTTSSEGIRKTVGEVLAGVDERFKISQNNSIVSANIVKDNASTAISEIGVSLEDFSTTTEEAVERAGDNIDTFTDDSLDKVDEKLGVLQGTTNDWKGDLDNLKTTIQQCATDITGWKDAVDAAMTKANEYMSASYSLQVHYGAEAYMAGLSASAADTLGSSFDSLGSKAGELGTSIDGMANDVETAYDKIIQAKEAAKEAYDNMAEAAQNASTAAWEAKQNYDEMKWSAQGAKDEANAGSSAMKGLIDAIAKAPYNIYTTTLNSLEMKYVPPPAVTSYTDYGTVKNNKYTNPWQVKSGSDYYMDSGGYTGTWSDKGQPGDNKDGKWALLHKKELVLNEEDTKNMLSTVELVRDIMSGINSIPSMKGAVSSNNYGNTVDQRVEINATFPGVTEAIEIKQALEQLADNAYQEAHRYSY